MQSLQGKIETIQSLLDQITNYKPIYSGHKEAERLHHYRDVICEDITYIIEAVLKGERIGKIEIEEPKIEESLYSRHQTKVAGQF